MSGEVAIIVAVLAALGSVAAILTFWMRLSDRITKAHGIAEYSLQEAAEAKKDAENVRVQIAALDGRFSLYREAVAKEYVSRETLRELEQRVTNSVESVRSTTAEGIKTLHGRLDTILTSLGELHAK